MSKDSDKTKAEQAEHPPLSDLEREFFEKMMAGGQPVPDDFVDPDLETLGPKGEDLAVARPMLLVMVLAFAVFLMSQYTSELRYAFTPSEPIDLGAVEELRFDDEWYAGDEYQLPSNRYVSLYGLPEIPSGSGNRGFYHLLGSTIVVEEVATVSSDLEMREETLSRSYRTLHEAPGRLIAFEELGSSYSEVVRFYSNATRIHYCGVEPTEELERYFITLRGQAAADLYDELQRQPNEEEIDERMDGRDECQNGYLLIANHAPRDYWYFPLIYAVLSLISLASGYLLVRTSDSKKKSAKGKDKDADAKKR